MTTVLYPPAPVRRLGDLELPPGFSVDVLNQGFIPLPQIPGFGWHSCVPRHSGRKLQEAVDGVPKWHLLQHVAHAKRWVIEHIVTYLDGKLPVFLRKPKFVYDEIKIVQYVEQ